MKEAESAGDGTGQTRWRTREQIAAHFQVSARTIGGWMRRGILPYSKLGQLVRFETSICDRAFGTFKSRSVRTSEVPRALADAPRQWKTKAQIAGYFHLGVRTVTSLMARKALPFVKVGNVVRFDLAECEAVVAAAKTDSPPRFNRRIGGHALRSL